MSLPFDRGHLGRRSYKEKALLPFLSWGQNNKAPESSRPAWAARVYQAGVPKPHAASAHRSSRERWAVIPFPSFGCAGSQCRHTGSLVVAT